MIDDYEDYNKFKDFLMYYKEDRIISKDCRPVYDSITNISKNDNQESLVKSDYHMISLDTLCRIIYHKNRPSSVDGLYLINKKGNFKLYFIEFKGMKRRYPEKIELLKLLEEKCFHKKDSDCCYIAENISDLLYKIREDKIFSQLKKKPIESLFLLLPEAYEEYCLKKNIKEEDQIKDLVSLLSKMYTKIIIVIDDSHNLSNSQVLSRGRKVKEKLGKYQHYVDRWFNDYKIYSSNEFKKIFINNTAEFSVFIEKEQGVN
ncbi:MAG: hypothetical protein MJ203_00035 [archaeon]|nr:hypothetical protein [archaeon]